MSGCLEVVAIGFHLVTWHSQDVYNGINPGAYARTDCGMVAGAFYNSESRMSAYAGMVFEKPIGRLTPFIIAGAVTGYDRSPILPILTPGIGIELSESVGVRVAYLPPGGIDEPHGLHAAVEFRF